MHTLKKLSVIKNNECKRNPHFFITVHQKTLGGEGGNDLR